MHSQLLLVHCNQGSVKHSWFGHYTLALLASDVTHSRRSPGPTVIAKGAA